MIERFKSLPRAVRISLAVIAGLLAIVLVILMGTLVNDWMSGRARKHERSIIQSQEQKAEAEAARHKALADEKAAERATQKLEQQDKAEVEVESAREELQKATRRTQVRRERYEVSRSESSRDSVRALSIVERKQKLCAKLQLAYGDDYRCPD